MARADRNGQRKTRQEMSRRTPDLGYYFIVTDTEETERNYFTNLKDSLPNELHNRIVIKVSESRTSKLISACESANLDSQYREQWIVFDRDLVPGFDSIIREAEQRCIHVAWSNPCIEIWFHAYFGQMPAESDSQKCCHNLAVIFERKTSKKYEKSEKRIYSLLNRFGNEAEAIKIAENRLQSHVRNGKKMPSEMCPGTTVHRLVKEIRGKIGKV